MALLAVSASPHLLAQDNLRLEVLPLPVESKKALQDLQSRPYITNSEDWFLWCPSVVQGEDGKYHMFHSRWPKSIGFLSWLTHSEIVHAVSDQPQRPYRPVEVAIPATGAGRGGWFNAHNPKIKRFGDQYYIYFIQTRGDSFAEDIGHYIAQEQQVCPYPYPHV